MVQMHPRIQSQPLRGAQLGRQDSQPPGQSGLLSQGVQSPAPRDWSSSGRVQRPDRDCPGAVVEEPQFSPGRSPGCGLWSRNPAGQPRTQTGPGNADWAPSRFPVRSNWHYLPCENSDALRSIGGVTWRLSRGRPGDDCVRGAPSVAERRSSRHAPNSVHRRVNVVRAGANCEEQPICRLLFTVGLAVIEP